MATDDVSQPSVIKLCLLAIYQSIVESAISSYLTARGRDEVTSCVCLSVCRHKRTLVLQTQVVLLMPRRKTALSVPLQALKI